MPGPLTIILPKKGIVPDEVTAGLDSVALRCPWVFRKARSAGVADPTHLAG